MEIVKDQEYWNARIANGRVVLSDIPEDILKKVPQESWNAYVANRGHISDIPKDKLENVPQESWNARVANGCLYLGDFSEGKLENVPQELWNKYVANGWYVGLIPKDILKKVPQEYWAAKFSRLGDYYNPNHIYDAYNHNHIMENIMKKKLKQYYKDNPALKSKDETARKYAWETKSKETYETKYQLDIEKYRNGDIKISDIDINVFGNDYAVIDIIEVAHEKARKQFDELCQKYGYTDDSQIPNDLVKNFNKQLQEIDKAIKETKNYCNHATIKAKGNAEKIEKLASELGNMEV